MQYVCASSLLSFPSLPAVPHIKCLCVSIAESKGICKVNGTTVIENRSGDGFEHATDLHGKQLWAVKLGASRQICNTRNNGVLNTATVL
jgi:hypothetical protein